MFIGTPLLEHSNTCNMCAGVLKLPGITRNCPELGGTGSLYWLHETPGTTSAGTHIRTFYWNQ